MSKFTLGQRQFPMLGLRSQQPKNYVGPTLSCYLGRNRYFAQKEGLRKEGCCFGKGRFHTKGTFYHITTGTKGTKQLQMSFYTSCTSHLYPRLPWGRGYRGHSGA